MTASRIHCLLLLLIMLPAVEPLAQVYDYESLLYQRTSGGFRDTLTAALRQLHDDPHDGAAWGVVALVHANGVEFMNMDRETARTGAERALRAAQEHAPSGPYTAAAYGRIHGRDHVDAAESAARQCMADWPEFLECHDLLGDILRSSGQLGRAEYAYRTAMTRWPDSAELQTSYAMLLEAMGNTAEAISLLRQLTTQQPEFPRAHWQLANLLYQYAGDVGAARRSATQALALDPLIWNSGLLLKLLDVAEAAAEEAGE